MPVFIDGEGRLIELGAMTMNEVSGPGVDPGSMKKYGLVLLVAVVVRMAWAVVVPVSPVSDSMAYNILARNIAAGDGYVFTVGQPTMYWAVGPAFLFSLVYRVCGTGYGAIVVLNLLMGVGSVALVMRLARRWFGTPSDWLAGLVLALWPSQVEFTTVLSSETPFLFLMLAAWLVFETDRLPGWLRAGLVGVLVASASYMRPTGLLLAPVFVLGHLGRGRSPVRLAAELALTFAVMAACITPWALRNKHYFGKAVWISANGGVNTWMGNSPDTNGGFRGLPPSVAGMNELEREEFLKAEARTYILQNPGQFVIRTLVKFVRLHERESIGVIWNGPGLAERFSAGVILAIKIASNVYWWGALTLAIAGGIALIRARGLIRTLFQPAVLIWGYFAAVHAITVAQDRYHFPIIPSLAILAGYVLASQWATKEAGMKRKLATGGTRMEHGSDKE